jgi:hypothetical protein
VGSGPLTGKVGDGGTHPGGATPVRAERMMTWRRSTDAEVLWPAPVALEFLRRGKSAATVAQKVARSGGGTGTSADQRPRWRGVLVVCFEGRTEEEKNGARQRRVAPFLNGTAGSRGRGGSGSVAWRDAWKEGDEGGPGSDRWAASRLTAARPRRARATRRCPNRGAPRASDPWAPADSRREKDRREAGCVGRPGEKGKWAEPEGTRGFLIYSNRIQTSSNGFDQKLDLPSFKNYK